MPPSYNGEQVFHVNGVGNMTRDWKSCNFLFEWDTMNGSLTDFMATLLEFSKGLFDARVDLRVYNEEDWHFMVTGWRETDEDEKQTFDNWHVAQEEKKIKQAQKIKERERAIFLAVAAKYGITTADVPPTDEMEVVDPSVGTGIGSGYMPSWFEEDNLTPVGQMSEPQPEPSENQPEPLQNVEGGSALIDAVSMAATAEEVVEAAIADFMASGSPDMDPAQP